MIRRELHDGLVPWLAGLRLGLQGVQNTLASDPATSASMLTELRAELTRRIDDVRSASRSLLPPVLSELGLYAALVELVDRQDATGMTVELRCPPASAASLTGLPEGLAAAAYGIASEAVTNAARHSGTDRCVLEIEVDETDLLIRCRDAGSGIAADAVTGVGTRSMIERAEEQGGSVTTSAGVPRGTVVTATLPLRRPARTIARSDVVIKVVVVDDHPVFRLGMVGLLDSLDGIRVTGQAADRAGLQRAIDEPPHVILMDLHLDTPSGESESGIELTRWLSHAHPEIAVLVITMSEDDSSVAAAMRAGARGYLLKAAAPEEVERAVRAVANGEMILGPQVAARAMAQVISGRAAVRVPFPELTDREREVLDLVARGFDNATISQRLVLSPKTVRNHIANVLAKLSLKDRAAAIVAAREAGLGG